MKENQIYVSSNYADFHFKEANREVKPKCVDYLAKRMEEVGWQGVPIQVSINDAGQMVIEDGQHRYMAAKKTNTPIRFMVVPPKTTYDLAIENSLNSKWSIYDFIDTYAKQGSLNYKRLKQLVDEFPEIPVTDICTLVSDKRSKSQDVKKGYFKMSDELFYKAREELKDLVVLHKALENAKVRTKSAYSRCLIKLLRNELIDPQRMVDKIDKFGGSMLNKSVGITQAILELDAIYNHHQTKSTVVHFFDKVRTK
jgi:hypothetical protein